MKELKTLLSASCVTQIEYPQTPIRFSPICEVPADAAPQVPCPLDTNIFSQKRYDVQKKAVCFASRKDIRMVVHKTDNKGIVLDSARPSQNSKGRVITFYWKPRYLKDLLKS